MLVFDQIFQVAFSFQPSHIQNHLAHFHIQVSHGLLEYENAPDDFECDWAEMKKPLEKFGQIPTSL